MKQNTTKKNWTVFFLMIFSFLYFDIIFAQSELTDAQVQERIQLIQQMLDQGKSNANLWWYGWLAGYSAATVGQGVVYFTSDDKSTKEDMALGAATTFLGAIGQIITPMTPGYAPDRLAELPKTTPAERANKLKKAEELLKASAVREIEGRSWTTRAVAGVVNLGSGIIVWRGFKRSIWEGLGNFALNTLITEAQIWTQPTKAIGDYEEYKNKIKSGEKLSYHKPHISWSLAVYPGGLGVYVHF